MENVPPIKFALEKPVKGKFMFESPLTGTSKDKEGKEFEYHLYKFQAEDGSEQVFFASKGLHAQLKEKGDLKDKGFCITKVIARDESGNLKEDKMGRAINEFKVDMVDVVIAKPTVEAEEKEVNIEDIPF